MAESDLKIAELEARLESLVRTQIGFQSEITAIRSELTRLRNQVRPLAAPIRPAVPPPPASRPEAHIPAPSVPRVEVRPPSFEASAGSAHSEPVEPSRPNFF